jgi:hypothetical protein
MNDPIPASDPVLLAIQKTAGNQAVIRAIESGLVAPPQSGPGPNKPDDGSTDGVRA